MAIVLLSVGLHLLKLLCPIMIPLQPLLVCGPPYNTHLASSQYCHPLWTTWVVAEGLVVSGGLRDRPLFTVSTSVPLSPTDCLHEKFCDVSNTPVEKVPHRQHHECTAATRFFGAPQRGLSLSF